MKRFDPRVAGVLFIVLSLGCDRSIEEVVSPEPPDGNHAIKRQLITGSPTSETATWQAVTDGEGGVYTWGTLNGSELVSRMSGAGVVRWAVDPGLYVNDIVELPGLGYALVGRRYYSAFATVATFDAAGQPIDQLTLPHDGVWFWTAALRHATGGYEGVAVGRFRKNGETVPYAVPLTISAGGEIEVPADSMSYDGVQGDFTTVVMTDDTPPVYYAASYGARLSSGGTSVSAATFWRLDESLDVDWQVLEGGQYGGQRFEIARDATMLGADVVFVGGLEAAYAVRMQPDGTEVWSRWWGTGDTADLFESVVYDGSRLMAAGFASGRKVTQTQRTYGHGLFATIDPSDGEASLLTVGSADYSSAFQALVVINAAPICFGWTHHYTGAAYQGWFVELIP